MQPGKRSSNHPVKEAVAAERLARLVELACRFQRPRPTCPLKAIVLQRLLAKCAFGTELIIGADRPAGRFAAHAWLQHRGRAIYGAGSVQYHPLHSSSGQRDLTNAV